ncbi:uncharacterized protein A4U43_C01F4100 [Asparagus officinalis]|uniref:Cyclin N-terminal domain-containing protein n=2 Tax=Asparagus officinalis TaxID=4686 RepID=A0A5P1FLM2_ASPOF|nr:uncharacterized protein A4U43_C01F4100 [Asparagus officinalis]
MEFSLEDPYPDFPTEDLFAMENNYRTSMWAPLSFARRRSLILLILRVRRSRNLHRRTTYLAINYVDRLIHSRHFPEVDHISLVAITCLSLASQYSDSAGSFTVRGLEEEDGFVDLGPDARYRADLQVRAALNGELNSITPFAFLDFFILEHLFPVINGHNLEIPKFRASTILFHIQIAGENMLRYKPSVIAASALLCAVNEMFPPPQFEEFTLAVRFSEFMDEDMLELCFVAMWETIHDDEE